jgi:hypothetical protein
MTWKAIYKELILSFGWHRENYIGTSTPNGAIICSPTRPIGIFFGDMMIKNPQTSGLTPWHRQGKLPPVKDFDIAMDKKTKLLTYMKNGMQLIAVDVS